MHNMDNSQDKLGLDHENNRTIFLRESDPFLPIIPSPEIEEEPLEEGLKTSPATPLHFPHAFLKEDRRLFSPPPVLTVAPTRLDNFETGFNSTLHDTELENKSPVFRKKTTHPASLELPSEGYPPRKRIKPNTVAALLDHSSRSRRKSESTTVGIDHLGVHPVLLVRSVTLPVGTEPAVWKPSPLLQIVSHPTPDLVRRLTTSHIPHVSSLACQTHRK